MILGIGVDLVFIPRITAIVDRHGYQKFSAKILSPQEIVFTPSLNDQARAIRFLAVRWAVKEAAYKALYPTLKVRWKDLAFIPLGELSAGSKPHLQLLGAKKHAAGELFASVSHDGEYVFASVFATRA